MKVGVFLSMSSWGWVMAGGSGELTIGLSSMSNGVELRSPTDRDGSSSVKSRRDERRTETIRRTDGQQLRIRQRLVLNL